MDIFTSTVALIGVVIVVASLLSGALERTGVPVVAVFLALGALLGPHALGLTDVALHSPSLHALSVLALTLVLFSDAATIDTKALRAGRWLLLTVLGPGTVIPAAAVSLAAWALLDLPAPAAAILGAALASTDPVLLRSLMRSPGLPEPTRLALRMESGMNDIVLLPIVIIAMSLLGPAVPGEGVGSSRSMVETLTGLFLLGPALGVMVGWAGIIALARIRDSVGVRRDYESLYAIGLAFSAFALAESVGGSGFVAAFVAGLLVAAQDVELCECFLEYGEASAEMLLLLTFVALGTTLIWSGLTVIDGRTLAFAAVALTARTVVIYPVLGARVERYDRRLIALLGPRGLSSLLLVLLPVFAGVQGAEQLFAVACLVVLLSVVVHGGGIALFLRRCAHGADQSAPAATPASSIPVRAPGPKQLKVLSEVPEKITLAELDLLQSAGHPVVIIDARRDRHYRNDTVHAAGAVHVDHHEPVRDATALQLPQDATLAIYCNCPSEETSLKVAHRLREAGWPKARALVGGWRAWQDAGRPLEAKAAGRPSPTHAEAHSEPQR